MWLTRGTAGGRVRVSARGAGAGEANAGSAAVAPRHTYLYLVPCGARQERRERPPRPCSKRGARIIHSREECCSMKTDAQCAR